MKWFYIIAVLLTVALVAAPFWLLEKEDSTRLEGKVVEYISYSSKIDTIDPASCNSAPSVMVQGCFYEGLYTYHYLKRPLEVIPELAESMPDISDDGLTYTIRVKKGIKYARNPCFGRESGGKHKYKTRTVTADDFVLAFKRVADFHVSSPLSLALLQGKILGMDDFRRSSRIYAPGDFSRYEKEDLPGVMAKDKHTLVFRLTARFPQIMYVLALKFYAPTPHEVISYHLSTRDDGKGGRESVPIKERTTEVRRPEAAVGTGAYMMTKWVRGSLIIMDRNSDFHETLYPSTGAPGDDKLGLLEDVGRKVPFTDARHMMCIPESNPDWMLFRAGLQDYALIPSTVFQTVISPSAELIETYRKEGIRLLRDPHPGIWWIAFNLADNVMGKSRSLRQGMYMAFDVDKYIEVIWTGRGKRALNIIPSMLKGHKEAGPGPYARVDLEAARKKIEQAKKELADADVIKPGEDIPVITMDFSNPGEQNYRIAEFMKSEFRKVGIRMKIEFNDYPTLLSKMNNKQYQALYLGWYADYPDAENFLQNFYSPNIELNTNYFSYANEEFDRLFEAAGKLPKIDDRVPLYAQMARMISEDVPVMLLREPIIYTLVRSWTHNYKYHPIAAGIEKNIRIDTELRGKSGGRER